MWNDISVVAPVPTDAVERNGSKVIEVQRGNGNRRFVKLEPDDTYSLPVDTVAWRQVEPNYSSKTYNLELVRWHVIEVDENNNESILGIWDYSTKANAEGYIATFGAGRNLYVSSFVNTNIEDSNKRNTYAVIEPTPGTGEDRIVEVKLTQSNAQAYANIFGGDLRVEVLEEYPLP